MTFSWPSWSDEYGQRNANWCGPQRPPTPHACHSRLDLESIFCVKRPRWLPGYAPHDIYGGCDGQTIEDKLTALYSAPQYQPYPIYVTPDSCQGVATRSLVIWSPSFASKDQDGCPDMPRTTSPVVVMVKRLRTSLRPCTLPRNTSHTPYMSLQTLARA